jgi:hypothetical protein
MSAPYRLRAQQPASGTSSAADVLGQPVRSYYAAAHRASIVAVTPFVLLLAYVVWLAHQGEILHWFNSNFSAFAVTVLLLLSIVLIAHTSAVGGGELVRLHDGGILDLRAGPRAVRWDEVESLTAVVAPNGSILRHVLRTTDGAQLSLGRSIAGVEDLVDVIRSRMLDHVAPAMRARIAEGGELHFGPLAASEAGIALGPRVIPWEDLEDVDAEAGEVVVRGTGGARLAVAQLEDVPNAFLLAEIVHERKHGGQT